VSGVDRECRRDHRNTCSASPVHPIASDQDTTLCHQHLWSCPRILDAERRQLTVMFIASESTKLASQLDPEDCERLSVRIRRRALK